MNSLLFLSNGLNLSLVTLLGWGFCFSAICWIVAGTAKNWLKKNQQRNMGISLMRHMQAPGSRRVAVSLLAVGLIVGFAGGYEIGIRRPQPVARNIKPMDQVLVVAKYPNCHYTMRRKDGRNFETDFCSDSPEGCTLEAGYLLTEFNFHQQANCKSTVGQSGESLGFSVYSEHGQKIKFPIGEIAIAR